MLGQREKREVWCWRRLRQVGATKESRPTTPTTFAPELPRNGGFLASGVSLSFRGVFLAFERRTGARARRGRPSARKAASVAEERDTFELAKEPEVRSELCAMLQKRMAHNHSFVGAEVESRKA
jgi:hypothetical protein